MTKIFINNSTKNNSIKIGDLENGDFFELHGLLYIKCSENYIYQIKDNELIDIRNTFAINNLTLVIHIDEVNINYKSKFASTTENN